MKILLTQNSAEFGGVQSYLLDLARGLVDRGHTVFVATGDGPMIQKYKQANAQVILLSPQRDIDTNYITAIANVIKKEQIDIIHTSMLKSTINGLIGAAASGTKVKKVAHIHGTLIDWEVPLYKKVPNIVANTVITNLLADKVIALTPSIRKDLIAREKIFAKKIVTIPNGIDLNRFNNLNRSFLRKKLKLKENVKIVGTFSRLTIEKGINFFLQAIPEVIQKNKNVHFVIPSDGKDRETLVEEAHHLGVSEYTSFIGTQSDIDKPNILASYNVFVFPSIREGFGIAMIEAMAAKTPVICSDLPVLQDIVTDHKSALLFKTGNPLDLAMKINTLLVDDSLSCKIAESAYKIVKAKYTIEQFIDNYEALYQSLI